MTARRTADKARIAQWLEQQGLAQYARAFKEHNIGFDVLPGIGDEDLKELGVPLGDRKRLLKAIAELQMSLENASDSMTSAAARGPPIRHGDPERRQLTLLFCDLVASTELSARLDPEDLREVVHAYQACVAAVVERFEGHVAKYLGDGVLVYFGYPRAHEDDAERAVRTGLELVHAVAKLRIRPDVELEARVGIATGTAVVGDLIGEGASREAAVVGDVPNLAARLQALAMPSSVVISQATRRLVGGLFELAELGPLRLKGFAEPLAAWRVEGEGPAESRFEARQSAGLTPLVGREEELALLLDRWEQARDGEGQVVLLSGEPGIGKSRVLETLGERLVGGPHVRLRYQCSPYHVNSALHPIIDQLERAAGFQREDAAEVKLEKLEALLAQGTEKEQQVAETAPLFADLLAIPTGDRYLPTEELSPERRQERLFEALVAQLEGLAAKQPVLDVSEDAHWIDPTSLELLGRAVDRVQRLPVLLVITFRPDFAPRWTGYPHVTLLTLNRLGRRQVVALAERVAGGKALPAEVLAQIVAKTDGVPLFVEELTKAVLESGLLRDEGDRYALAGPLPALAIPATLHDSLMARLDRLASVKEVAQIGAALGREFSHELLAAVVPHSEERLRDALDQLVEAELVFRRGTPPEASYTFKHALVQDAAYESLLRSRRQQLHARIAQILEERFPETAATEPELLAQHCTQAGLAEQAAAYWHKAGQRALARSATAEAVAQLSQGLEVLQRLPDGPERQRQEHGLQLVLGHALTAAKGYSAPETGRAFARARELCRQIGDTTQLFPVLFGQYVHHLVRAEPVPAREVAEEMLRLARQQDDTAAQVAAHRAVGSAFDDLGELSSARAHLEQALALYDPVAHRSLAFLYAQDPRVAGLCWLSRSLFALGYPEQSLARIREAWVAARELAHPHTVAHALGFRCNLCQLFQDRCGVEEQAEALITLGTEQSFPFWLALGTIYQGWALADGGQAEAGIARVCAGLAGYWATGAQHRSPYLLALLAEVHGKAGETSEALDVVAEALARVEKTGECWFEAELHRLRGELLLSLPEPNRTEAEACFRRAMAVARGQEAKLWELRAAMSLARLWRDQGRRAQAHDLLAPVYGWFSEGFNTTDLKEAKRLLDELS